MSGDGYWCELVARSPDGADEWYLGGVWLSSPDEALTWLRDQAARLASALDSSVGQVFAEWLADIDYQSVQLATLRAGRPVSANAGGMDRIAGRGDLFVFYSLTCRPVMAHHPQTQNERRKKQSCTTN